MSTLAAINNSGRSTVFPLGSEEEKTGTSKGRKFSKTVEVGREVLRGDVDKDSAIFTKYVLVHNKTGEPLAYQISKDKVKRTDKEGKEKDPLVFVQKLINAMNGRAAAINVSSWMSGNISEASRVLFEKLKELEKLCPGTTVEVISQKQ